MVLFGPSGNSESFYNQGFKHSVQMPGWLRKMDLDAYEYSCTKGVKLKRETALELKNEAEKNSIVLSVHSPYYINLATSDEEKRKKSIKYITDTAAIADAMGAKRVVVHSGACSGMPRETALAFAKKTLTLALEELKNLGLGHIHICPETMGKINQLGTLEEVMELCSLDESLIPTIDFGHLYARTFGGLVTKKDFENIYLVPCEGLANAIEVNDTVKQEKIVSSIYEEYKDKEIYYSWIDSFLDEINEEVLKLDDGKRTLLYSVKSGRNIWIFAYRKTKTYHSN